MALLDVFQKTASFLQNFDEAMGAKVQSLFTKAGQFIEDRPGSFLDVATRIPEEFRKTTPGKILSKVAQTITPKSEEEGRKAGLIKIGGAYVDPLGAIGGLKTVGKRTAGGVAREVLSFLKPTESRIAQEGKSGEQLMKTITKAFDEGEVAAGKRIDSFVESGLNKLKKPDRFNLTDVLEGKAQPQNPQVQKVFNAIKPQLDDVARESKETGVVVKEKVTLKPTAEVPTGLTPFQREQLIAGKNVPATIKRPFEPRENFFPHDIPPVENLKSGVIRDDVVENLVRRGIRPNVSEASRFVDEFVSFVESGKRQDSLLNYMVQTGQSANTADALANLQRFRQRVIKRQGSLEFARQVDLPFYDPDPARVLPSYLASTSKRLAQIRNFGQNQETINKLIKKIMDEGGDANTVRMMVDRILEINKNATGAEKLSLFLRTIQGFKLGLAAIPNITQGVMNSLLAGDLRSVAAGIAGVFSTAGRRFALRSGSTLDSVISEALRYFGATDRGVLARFLKATGFTATERLNRILAANAGKNLGERLFQMLKRNPADKRALFFFKELGIDVSKALERGSLVEDEILTIAKKFVDLTQFRSRPQDLPFFASTPSGKIFFQFKNFIYGQTRLISHALIGEFKSGNWGRAVRNFIILATVFPMVGEVVADIRSLITGRKRTEKGLGRYFDDIAQVGSMGILSEMIRSGSFGKGTEFVAGPTVGDIGEVINIAGKEDQAKNALKFLFKKIPLAGQILGPRAFPPKSQKRETTPSGNRFDL